jgi:predicted RNA-binding protein
MLTETYLKEHFIDAYFIDNERQNIEVLQTNEDKTQVFTTIIPFNEDNGNFKKLTSIISVDELHENTYNKKKEERKLFEDQIKRIAEKEGLVKKIVENVDSNFFNVMFDFLLSNKQEHIDRLFNFKIHIFEQELIKKSNNEEAKTAIRKSKTPLEALKNFVTIWEESN